MFIYLFYNTYVPVLTAARSLLFAICRLLSKTVNRHGVEWRTYFHDQELEKTWMHLASKIVRSLY